MMVYPYGRDEIAFGRFQEMTGKELLLVSPKGWGYAGRDISVCDGGSSAGKVLLADPLEGIRQADEILLLDAKKKELPPEHYGELLHTAKEAGKKIYVTKKLACVLREAGMEDLLSDVVVLGSIWEEKESGNGDVSGKLLRIPIPVIAVAGVGEQCNQFELLTAIGSYFREKGYQVLAYGTREYGSFFGVETLPDFVWDGDESPCRSGLHDRILWLNHGVYDRIRKTKADLLLVEVPGTLMSLNPYTFEDFGEKAVLVHTALPADAGVLSVYAHPYTEEYLTHMTNLCQYRYNMPVDCFHLSNTNFDISQDTLQKEYMTLESERVCREYGSGEFPGQPPMFHWLEKDGLANLCRTLEKKLTGTL